MGYSARYHAASLAAVFLSLAIGILIGVGFGDDLVSGTAESLEASLESDLEEARARADELAAELEREQEFGQRVYPALVGERLDGETVGVVALGGLPEELAAEIEATLEPTQARLQKVAVVREPPDLRSLRTQLGGRFRRLEDDPETVERLGRRVGRQLVTGGSLLDEAGEQLLTRFAGQRGALDNVILVSSPPGDVDPEQEESLERFRAGLLEGVREAGRPAVAVELASTDPSTVPLFDRHGIPTVDSLDLTAGKLSAVFALLGAEGNFGIKEGADRLVPDLVLPVPARGLELTPGSGGRGGEKGPGGASPG